MTVQARTDPREAIRARVGELLEQEHWTREQLLSYQQQRVDALLRHAIERSPYYREALGADATDRPLASLPTLSKELLMEQFDSVVTDPLLRRTDVEAFVPNALPGDLYEGRFHIFSTSGSTGVPGLFAYAPDEFAEWTAVSLSRLVRAGVGPDTRLLAIGAPSDAHITKQLFAAFSAGRKGVPRVNVTTPWPELLDALDGYQPEALIAYASVLGMLADEQLSGQLQIAPQVTIAGSEVLTDAVSEKVTRAWGAAPVNVYAATEAPGIAIGSPDGEDMYVCEESIVLEVVDDEDRPVPPGVPGAKVLLTNLVNRVQPLIRYELSDSAVLAEGEDPSGRPYTRLARVDGRSDDVLELSARSGGTVSVHPYRLHAPFSRLHDVRQFQVVHDADGLLVRIVPREEAGPALPEQVRAAIAAEMTSAGADVPVRVELARAIERESGPAGKVKLVRSAV
jgi:phenylacetate-CoA ligase